MTKKLYEVTMESDFFVGTMSAEIWANSEEEAQEIAYFEWTDAPRDADAILIDEESDYA